jgi:RNA polymerase sigma factor for flagellar operon FliA
MEERRNIKRREFVEKYIPYVSRMVVKIKRHLPPGMEFNDLLNSAIIGLMMSIDRYNPEKNDSFISFARQRIKGSVVDAFHTHDILNKYSRRILKEYRNVKERMEKETGVTPNFEEIVVELNFSEEKKMTLCCLIAADECISYDTNEFKSLVNDTEDLLDQINQKEIINIKIPQAINKLNKKEQEVIISYFYNEESLKEIGDKLNVTDTRISQLKSSALKNLRRKLKEIEIEL